MPVADLAPIGSARGTARRSVLIVEDDPAVARMVATLVRQVGWQPVAVASGEEALRIFSPGLFSRLICDVDLGPGMDGFETALRLRQAQPGLGVLFITGSLVHAGMSAAPGPILPKPFAPEKLLSWLER